MISWGVTKMMTKSLQRHSKSYRKILIMLLCHLMQAKDRQAKEIVVIATIRMKSTTESSSKRCRNAWVQTWISGAELGARTWSKYMKGRWNSKHTATYRSICVRVCAHHFQTTQTMRSAIWMTLIGILIHWCWEVASDQVLKNSVCHLYRTLTTMVIRLIKVTKNIITCSTTTKVMKKERKCCQWTTTSLLSHK